MKGEVFSQGFWRFARVLNILTDLVSLRIMTPLLINKYIQYDANPERSILSTLNLLLQFHL